MKKKRLDVLLVERGMADSRQKAQTLIMAGLVSVGGKREDKAGTQIPPDAVIAVKEQGTRFVSRGGFKLQKALSAFSVDPKDRICLDAGASTGGFTDCLLQHGALKVYAVDVGYGQLDWKLRTDPRVVPLERTNLRYVTKAQIPEPISLATLDVSFISLRLVLPAVFSLLEDGGHVLCLIKPQFEAGREKVGKKGVVRDPDAHEAVLEAFGKDAAAIGFSVRGLSFSPICGPEGNIEFLGHLTKSGGPAAAGPEAPDAWNARDIPALVSLAHQTLSKGNAE